MNEGGKRRTGAGFTLIELMIVVGIIGTLASIAIPVFNDYVDKARDTEPVAHIKHMFQGLATYYNADQATQGMAGTLQPRCLPAISGAQPYPFPLLTKRTVVDFTTNPSFAALDFAPAGPVSHSYWFGGPPVSGCLVETTIADGNCSAMNDLDNDGNVRIIFFEWAIVNRELIRGPGVIRREDFPSPW